MGSRKITAGGELFALSASKTIPMDNKIMPSGANPDNKKKKNWLKWAIIAIPSLIVVFVICYALQWVLWKWIWLAIPVWIICYLLHEKFGTNEDTSVFHKIPKTFDRDEIKKWMNKQ